MKKLRNKKDTYFPGIESTWIFRDGDEDICSMSEEKETEIIWRHQMSFLKLKPTADQGPKPSGEDMVTEIVAEAAEYARVHLSRPFQLFSIGLLVFGKKFCVAIFDRDGVQLSPVYDLWDDLNILIRIIRRMCHEMTPVDFGQDPNVQLLSEVDPVSIACHERAKALANEDGMIDRISVYPTYSVDFCGLKYYTIGPPVSNSVSLLGRGTLLGEGNRPSESAILQGVKGSHDGLVKYSQGSDVFFPSPDAFPQTKITTASLQNLNRHVEKDDAAVLHRLIFETVGCPIWEFNSYLDFFLGIKAALNAHRFLVDQGILHRDISAGNVLLCWDPNEEKDSRKGFLTDLEFAWIDDETLKTKNHVPIPSVSNPIQANRMTTPTTRTHTAWGPPPRDAVMTVLFPSIYRTESNADNSLQGTVQFMACELVLWRIMAVNPQPLRHRVHHDVESFICVIYYAILWRIGYVKRAIDEQRSLDEAPDDEVDKEIPKNLALSFLGLLSKVYSALLIPAGS